MADPGGRKRSIQIDRNGVGSRKHLRTQLADEAQSGTHGINCVGAPWADTNFEQFEEAAFPIVRSRVFANRSLCRGTDSAAKRMRAESSASKVATLPYLAVQKCSIATHSDGGLIRPVTLQLSFSRSPRSGC